MLRRGKAAVFRRYPFTIILKEALPAPQVQGLQLKIDPGSKMAGLAIVNDLSGEVMWAAELSHRGEAIKKALDDRRRVRRPGSVESYRAFAVCARCAHAVEF